MSNTCYIYDIEAKTIILIFFFFQKELTMDMISQEFDRKNHNQREHKKFFVNGIKVGLYEKYKFPEENNIQVTLTGSFLFLFSM